MSSGLLSDGLLSRNQPKYIYTQMTPDRFYKNKTQNTHTHTHTHKNKKNPNPAADATGNAAPVWVFSASVDAAVQPAPSRA